MDLFQNPCFDIVISSCFLLYTLHDRDSMYWHLGVLFQSEMHSGPQTPIALEGILVFCEDGLSG